MYDIEQNKEYIVILRSGSLQLDIEEYDHNIGIAEYINCSSVDRTTALDDLDSLNIDVWVDDEGLLKKKKPGIVFVDDNGKPSGCLAGDLAFLKYDESDNSYGLSWEECQCLKNWFWLHDYCSLTYCPPGQEEQQCFAYIIKPFETAVHRKRIEKMKEVFGKDGIVMEMW